MDEKTADDIQRIFNIKSKEEVEEILKRTERLSGAIASLKDDSSDALEDFHKQNEINISRAFKSNIEAMTAKREVPDRNVDKTIEQAYGRKKKPKEDYEAVSFDLDMYNDYMLHEEITDEGDPLVIMGEAHDLTLTDLKEQLLEAINKRKSKVLNITL